ncbi:MAG: hypothetical protein K6V36_17025 [Anaerolineae bacterium]|nr:hypothetical protein [Anaerolineae bacterium]
MSDLVLRPFLRRWWAAVVLGGLLLGPTTADAQSPVATVVIYEVAEALQFKGPKAATSPTELRRRLAEATLLGKDVQGREGTVFAGAQFIIVDAQSNVDLRTGVGPIRGTFDLLVDTDPTRESLDTLVITASGSLRGTLDLTTAVDGYAGAHGRWEARRARARGTFNGVFLIPFLVVDMVVHHYEPKTHSQRFQARIWGWSWGTWQHILVFDRGRWLRESIQYGECQVTPVDPARWLEDLPVHCMAGAA